MEDTVFHKIIRGELPAKKEYEDDDCIVIHSIEPKAPVHLLVIPKKTLKNVSDASEEDQQLLGKLLLVGRQMAVQMGMLDRFRIVINNGEKAGQTVFQLHVHVLGKWEGKPESSL